MNSHEDEFIIPVGTIYGCLEVLDIGDENIEKIDELISINRSEKEEFIKKTANTQLNRFEFISFGDGSPETIPAYVYGPVNFRKMIEKHPIDENDFDKVATILEERKKTRRYKCVCRHCRKIRYYTYDTLKAEPDFCLRPMYCSSRFTYSNKANNANYRKRQKYQDNEAIELVNDKTEVIPSNIYCDKWNNKQKRELMKKAKANDAFIASLPRVYAKNYEIDYVGRTYESLEIVECINAHYEQIPKFRSNSKHKNARCPVTVFKQYRCRCYRCNKEQIITCDKFGIYEPTEYGYRAYGGYWSDVSCDCHEISSFQWIVNKLLFENCIPYRVEVVFPDLLGVSGKKPLQFDFAVYHEDGSIKCLIECQGEQHFKPVEEFGGQKQFDTQKIHDEMKREYVKKNNIQLIELSYKNKKLEEIRKSLVRFGVLSK